MKIVVAAIAAISLACLSQSARAENGRTGAALLGGAAGVALGAAGATMLMNAQRRPAPVVVEEDEEPVSTIQHEPQRHPRATPTCRERMIDLFDSDGNFVKKDRVRICR